MHITTAAGGVETFLRTDARFVAGICLPRMCRLAIFPALPSDKMVARPRVTRMISTRDLAELPGVDALRRLMKSLAMLDAILSPEWDGRYYSFNSKWARGEQMGSMRDGCGNDYFALFNRHGCYLKGFHHEAAMTPYAGGQKGKPWPGLFDAVPEEFAGGVAEPAFCTEDTTFCIWRTYRDRAWRRGEIEFPKGRDPDGSAELLGILDGSPETYLAWATDHYETTHLNLDHVRHIYEHKKLTRKLVDAMRYDIGTADEDEPPLTLVDLADDVREIGYPDAG